MDRDLHELIEGADSGPIGDAGEGWAHIGMRWRPRPDVPTEQPRPVVIHINPALLHACEQLNGAFRDAAARVFTHLAASLERARKERS